MEKDLNNVKSNEKDENYQSKSKEKDEESEQKEVFLNDFENRDKFDFRDEIWQWSIVHGSDYSSETTKKEPETISPELEEEKLILGKKLANLQKDNKDLKIRNEMLKREKALILKKLQLSKNNALKSTLNNVVELDHSNDENSKLSLLQQGQMSSSLETMKAIFQKYDFKNNGKVSIKSVPQLCFELGENIPEEERIKLTEELETLTKDTKLFECGYLTFDQFFNWWISYKKKEKNAFKIISVDLKKSGTFKIKNVFKKNVGKDNTRAFRVRYFYKNKELGGEKQISPWHDIPLYPLENSSLVSFVCEVPKWTRTKYEVATREKLNPIKQDIELGVLRYYKHGDFMFNYGMIPQTFEDCGHTYQETGKRGDNDPLDAIEIGTKQMEVGEIAVVKVLGVLGLIDTSVDGQETDWKIITISIEDPLAHSLNDIDDVEETVPGCVNAIREYFRVYKKHLGYPNNIFAWDEMAKGKEVAIGLINQSHDLWKNLLATSKHGTVTGPEKGSQPNQTTEIKEKKN